MSNFSLTREISVAARADEVMAHLADLRAWQSWSPWEGLDPDLERTYSGAERGVGARYHWRGNSKAGEGTMEITEASPQHVLVDLTFLKPFKAENLSRFDLAEVATGTAVPVTRVVWTMTGRRNPLMQLLGRLFFDKAIGADFERGLAALKRVTEDG